MGENPEVQVKGSVMRKNWRILMHIGAALVLISIGWVGQFSFNAVALQMHRHCREELMVKATGTDIPLSILKVIHRQRRVSVADALSLIAAESGGFIRAKSKAGAIGLGQIMTNVAKMYGYRPEQMYIPDLSVKVMLLHYTAMLDTFGNEEDAIRAYNIGASAWAKAKNDKKRVPPEEPTKLLARWQSIRKRYHAVIEHGDSLDGW